MRRLVQWLLTIVLVVLGILWVALFLYNTGKVLPQLIGTILLILAAIGIGTLIKNFKDKR